AGMAESRAAGKGCCRPSPSSRSPARAPPATCGRRRADLKEEPPVLAGERPAERRVALLVDQLEPRSLVDPARVRQDVVRPEHELAVSGRTREPDALVHEPGSDDAVAVARLDQQQPELSDPARLRDAQDRPGAVALELRDPGPLAVRIV